MLARPLGRQEPSSVTLRVPPSPASGRRGAQYGCADMRRLWSSKPVAVLIVTLAILVLWYAGAVWMNADLQRDAFESAEQPDYTLADFVLGTLNLDRPKLPAPHQIVQELDKTVLETDPSSKRSLIFHG